MSLQIRKNLQQLFVLGVSYKKTALDIREKFALQASSIDNMLNQAKAHGVEGIIILSTCNRTELYCHTEDKEFVSTLFMNNTLASPTEFMRQTYELSGNDCIEHLFNVSVGLDSQIIGDFQIIGQIKDAYRVSESKHLVNSFLNRLFSLVFKSSKKVKNETELSKGVASVAHAAVSYIKDTCKSLETTKFLLIGTGDIGKITCANLLKHMDNRSLTLVNRTVEKAEQLARLFDVRYGDFNNLAHEVSLADVIIVATGASSPTLCVKHLSGNKTQKLILDLSVPRNVEAAVDDFEGVNVVSVDMLSAHISKSMSHRHDAIPHAEEIIRKLIAEFYGWLEIKYLSPVIMGLKENLQKIQYKELDYHKNKLTNEEYIKVEHITSNIVNKIARACINHLKDHHKQQSSPMETLDKIFSEID